MRLVEFAAERERHVERGLGFRRAAEQAQHRARLPEAVRLVVAVAELARMGERVERHGVALFVLAECLVGVGGVVAAPLPHQ